MQSTIALILLTAALVATGSAVAQTSPRTALDGTAARAPGLRLEPTRLALRANYPIGENWEIAGEYQPRRSFATRPIDGPPRVVPGRDDSMTLGLARRETLLRGDRLSLVVSQPSRLYGGVTSTAGLDITDYGQGLRAGAREVMTELQYFAPVTRSSGLGLSLINRMRPNSDALAPDERIMMMRFSTRF
jgi:hypothetical protein